MKSTNGKQNDAQINRKINQTDLAINNRLERKDGQDKQKTSRILIEDRKRMVGIKSCQDGHRLTSSLPLSLSLPAWQN